MPPRPAFQSEVVDIIQATPNTRRFVLKMHTEQPFGFRAGQFITLDLPIHEQPTKRLRSYSIASSPTDGLVELVIVLNESGLGTPYLFNEVRVGSMLSTMGALGRFLMPDVLDKPICFVCTGTGIAPFRSMIRYIYQNKVSHRGIYLICGSRYESDLLYVDEMRQMEQDLEGFVYIPTLSREKSAYWTGKMGYVHGVYEELFDKKPLKPCYFYLCGWDSMLKETRQRLQEMGYSQQDVHFERYG